MNEDTIFLHSVVRVCAYKKSESSEYSVVEEKKGLFTRETGKWVVKNLDYVISKSKLCRVEDFSNKGFYVEDDIVYEKPYCVVFLTNGSSKKYKFEDVESLGEFLKQFDNLPSIKL